MDEMPIKILNVFQNVFAHLPQRIIWQWENPRQNITMPQNILLSRWLPQQDLLGTSTAIELVKIVLSTANTVSWGSLWGKRHF